MTQTETQSSAGSIASPAASEPYPDKRTSHYALFILTVVVMFTVLDRQILALMIEPMKRDFHITDTQAALLIGAAFSITYGFSGLPIARIADRTNRRNLIATCIGFWSVATMACGVAQSYIQVLITRLAVGVGESGYGPATWSIITDSFPREKVAFGTSTLNIGAQVGTGLALFLGGWALAVVANFPTMDLPFGGRILNWQWAFILVGFPGLLWAFVVLTIREPKRRGLGGLKMKVVPISELARWIGNDWRAYLGCLGGVCMKYLMSMGPTTWLPTMLHRNFDWELSRAGLMLGAITIIVAPIALVIGGKWSERWTKMGMADANMRIMLYGLLVSVPVTIIMPLLPEPWMVLTAYGIALFISTSGVGPGLATFQLITPNAMRAQVSSLSQFGTNVLAFALAPLIIALFTDYLFGSSDMLHYSMALSNLVLGPIAILCVWQGIGPYRRAYERAVRDFG